jgi:hypothetical protein
MTIVQVAALVAVVQVAAELVVVARPLVPVAFLV